jgi:hypothetical protein
MIIKKEVFEKLKDTLEEVMKEDFYDNNCKTVCYIKDL